MDKLGLGRDWTDVEWFGFTLGTAVMLVGLALLLAVMLRIS